VLPTPLQRQDSQRTLTLRRKCRFPGSINHNRGVGCKSSMQLLVTRH
jgi:hypothetical protein